MSFDLIVIGGGHNGLTTAALAAKRGRRVLVLEKRDALGGLCAGREFHPGFRSVGVLHDASTVRPQVVEALQLESHGLRWRDAPPVFAPQRDGRGLLVHPSAPRTRADLGGYHPDAERYTAFRAFLSKLRGYVTRLLDEAPPPVAPTGIAGYWSLLRKAYGLRALGRDVMYECLRVAPMSVRDWLDEWFESDLLKAALAAPGLLGTWTSPRAAGTAALAWMHECRSGRDVAGGPAALVKALEAACLAHGVELRTGAAAQRLLVQSGRVTGVAANGDEINASLVASSIDPRRTLLDLVEPTRLPAGLAEPARNWRCRGTTAKVHLALDGPLEFRSRPGVAFEAARIAEDLDEIERAFDGVKYGELPERPHLDVRVPTVASPELAPTGQHVVSVLVHFVPYQLRGGWTDAAKQRVLQNTIARLTEVSPTCADRIVGHEVLTPFDLECQFGVTGGHVHHGEHGLDQLFALRPTADCARYATPIDGLFLCGSGSHPGGGVTCAPGWLAARALKKG